ncbi:hypothetical protein SAMN05421780_101811 [Flexibacter flexilis DSM 6793]|uniref:Uncharacterized protein n=1 Tax=Flexibacter flexilis DSM 6793 TaxID=927664 RepID=A0A1I1EHF5_9BACT|nr:hypothetical protein SAMN05421780_101811 [Flexibacter flexilis DSM 6793]
MFLRGSGNVIMKKTYKHIQNFASFSYVCSGKEGVNPFFTTSLIRLYQKYNSFNKYLKKCRLV